MTLGRPTKYNESYVEQVFKLALLGATDKEIADFFDVNEDTIHEWKKVHPDFSESLKDGKVKADAEIAKSLYERAKGFEYTEQQAFKLKTGKDTEEIEVVDLKKVSPPDTAAAMAWLKNRQPKVWRDKQDHEFYGKDGGAIETKNTSTAEDTARGLLFLLSKGCSSLESKPKE